MSYSGRQRTHVFLDETEKLMIKMSRLFEKSAFPRSPRSGEQRDMMVTPWYAEKILLPLTAQDPI
jgi:hypothetical protein